MNIFLLMYLVGLLIYIVIGCIIYFMNKIEEKQRDYVYSMLMILTWPISLIVFLIVLFIYFIKGEI